MTTPNPVVGVLALQGDIQKHMAMLTAIDIPSIAVRQPDDFAKIDRLIIPGGESTVIVELLHRLGMDAPFREFIHAKPVWGTCAGMILLATRVNDQSVNPYGVIDIAVDRNGYGRQVFSTVLPSELALNGNRETLELVFIRAPRVTAVGEGVTTLLKREEDPVLLSQNNILVSAFHPELTGSTFLHNYFARNFVIA